MTHFVYQQFYKELNKNEKLKTFLKNVLYMQCEIYGGDFSTKSTAQNLRKSDLFKTRLFSVTNDCKAKLL